MCLLAIMSLARQTFKVFTQTRPHHKHLSVISLILWQLAMYNFADNYYVIPSGQVIWEEELRL